MTDAGRILGTLAVLAGGLGLLFAPFALWVRHQMCDQTVAEKRVTRVWQKALPEISIVTEGAIALLSSGFLLTVISWFGSQLILERSIQSLILLSWMFLYLTAIILLFTFWARRWYTDSPKELVTAQLLLTTTWLIACCILVPASAAWLTPGQLGKLEPTVFVGTASILCWTILLPYYKRREFAKMRRSLHSSAEPPVIKTDSTIKLSRLVRRAVSLSFVCILIGVAWAASVPKGPAIAAGLLGSVSLAFYVIKWTDSVLRRTVSDSMPSAHVNAIVSQPWETLRAFIAIHIVVCLLSIIYWRETVSQERVVWVLVAISLLYLPAVVFLQGLMSKTHRLVVSYSRGVPFWRRRWISVLGATVAITGAFQASWIAGVLGLLILCASSSSAIGQLLHFRKSVDKALEGVTLPIGGDLDDLEFALILRELGQEFRLKDLQRLYGGREAAADIRLRHLIDRDYIRNATGEGDLYVLTDLGRSARRFARLAEAVERLPLEFHENQAAYALTGKLGEPVEETLSLLTQAKMIENRGLNPADPGQKGSSGYFLTGLGQGVSARIFEYRTQLDLSDFIHKRRSKS
jgi:hypothetical protein